MKTKAIKRKEAAQRNAAWSALSTREKLAALAKRPGGARRQMARLLAGKALAS